MIGCIRLVYVSKFYRNDDAFKLDLMNILTTSINYNTQENITGVLCYGNGYFIQCDTKRSYFSTILHKRFYVNVISRK